MRPTRTQKLAVFLAFVAAALSFAAAWLAYSRQGRIALTPLAGGVFMLILGMMGYARLKNVS